MPNLELKGPIASVFRCFLNATPGHSAGSQASWRKVPNGFPRTRETRPPTGCLHYGADRRGGARSGQEMRGEQRRGEQRRGVEITGVQWRHLFSTVLCPPASTPGARPPAQSCEPPYCWPTLSLSLSRSLSSWLARSFFPRLWLGVSLLADIRSVCLSFSAVCSCSRYCLLLI